MKFDSFKKNRRAFEEQGYLDQIDYNPNANEIVHIGILGLCSFYNKYNKLQEINNKNNGIKLINLSKDIFNKKEPNKFWLNSLKKENEKLDELFQKTIKNISLWAKEQISPIASFLGGNKYL